MKNPIKALVRAIKNVDQSSLTIRNNDSIELQSALTEIRAMSQSLKAIEEHLRDTPTMPLSVRENIDTLRKLAMKPLYNEIDSAITPRILSMPDTIREIANNNRSLSRFGDGEFKAMLRLNGNLNFQRTSPRLRSELEAVLRGASDSEQTLVGLPEILPGPHWTNVWADYFHDLEPLLAGSHMYGNSHVTRPVFFMQWREEAVEGWRKVFQSKRICIVTGQGSRFELIPELFDGAKSSEFVYGPSRHAYEFIDEIERKVESVSCDLVLISLGPAGTALARRLANDGRQALDIGHISASYNTAFKNSPMPEFVPYKSS